MNEIVVHSLGEFIDRVTPTEPDPVTGRRRDSGIYRGSIRGSGALLTSLDRLGGVDPPHTKAELEEHLLRNFIRYSRPHLRSEPVNEWELLVLAQHHGLPTRLLDWTYSPLVAAHFATLRPGAGGERSIWRLDWKQVHQAFNFPGLALLIEDLHRLFGGDEPFTPWKFINPEKEIAPFACMMEPPSLDARIMAQSAVFTLCSDKSQAFNVFLEKNRLGHTLTRFLIPEQEIARVRDQLDLASVDERRLFPDLEGVTAQMRRYYS
jgi:hypothetical protein